VRIAVRTRAQRSVAERREPLNAILAARPCARRAAGLLRLRVWPNGWLFDLSLLRNFALFAMCLIGFLMKCMKGFITRKCLSVNGFWALLYEVYEGGSYSRNALWARDCWRSV
jgi:hypothetical protein